jgi:nitrite reductase (NADH) small subunit
VKVSDTLTLAVCELDGAYHAVDQKCPHRAAPLSEGTISGELIVCPLHHFKFHLQTGRCLMPRHLRLRSFAVTRAGDQLQIEVKEADVRDAAAPAAADTAPAGTPGPAG